MEALKNTMITSEIDFLEQQFDRAKVDYAMQLLGSVKGRGVYDVDEGMEGIKAFPIRKLIAEGKVWMEQMQRGRGKYDDDYLISRMFVQGREPKDWKIEVWV